MIPPTSPSNLDSGELESIKNAVKKLKSGTAKKAEVNIKGKTHYITASVNTPENLEEMITKLCRIFKNTESSLQKLSLKGPNYDRLEAKFEGREKLIATDLTEIVNALKDRKQLNVDDFVRIAGIVSTVANERFSSSSIPSVKMISSPDSTIKDLPQQEGAGMIELTPLKQSSSDATGQLVIKSYLPPKPLNVSTDAQQPGKVPPLQGSDQSLPISQSSLVNGYQKGPLESPAQTPPISEMGIYVPLPPVQFENKKLQSVVADLVKSGKFTINELEIIFQGVKNDNINDIEMHNRLNDLYIDKIRVGHNSVLFSEELKKDPNNWRDNLDGTTKELLAIAWVLLEFQKPTSS